MQGTAKATEPLLFRGRYFFPGPVEVRPEILQTMMRPMIPHRGDVFTDLHAELQHSLRYIFRTQRPVCAVTASGTAMMEASIRSAPPGRVLCAVNGEFAQRFVEIARRCAREADTVDFVHGESIDWSRLEDAIRKKQYALLTLVHSETSTGALSVPPREFVEVAHALGTLMAVDSVSGIGGAEFDAEALGVDVVFTASQKALALPPGLAFAVLSDRFLEGARRSADRGRYLDLVEYHHAALANRVAATPAVSLFYAAHAQGAHILAETIEERWKRHFQSLALVAEWCKATPLRFLAELRSPTVSVLELPSGLDSAALVKAVASRGYVIGGGYGDRLRASTIRIGHMGDHRLSDLEHCLSAISDSLAHLGY